MKRTLLRMALMLSSASAVGAQCQSATPLTRTCAGAAVDSEKFFVAEGCGGAGVVEIGVASAGQCALTLTEAEGVNLPTQGTFAPAAGAAGYVLGKGNWNLQPPTNGMLGDNGGLSCTVGDAASGGLLEMTCTITTCSYVGEDLEPTCTVQGSCNTTLTPTSADAAISGPPLDAGVDATVTPPLLDAMGPATPG